MLLKIRLANQSAGTQLLLPGVCGRQEAISTASHSGTMKVEEQKQFSTPKRCTWQGGYQGFPSRQELLEALQLAQGLRCAQPLQKLSRQEGDQVVRQATPPPLASTDTARPAPPPRSLERRFLLANWRAPHPIRARGGEATDQ